MAQAETQFGNPYRFTGRRKDFEESSPFYYYRTRYYNPESGRFISHDTIGDWGDPLEKGNGLAYCGNNPVNLIDPLGLHGGVAGNYGRGDLRGLENVGKTLGEAWDWLKRKFGGAEEEEEEVEEGNKAECSANAVKTVESLTVTVLDELERQANSVEIKEHKGKAEGAKERGGIVYVTITGLQYAVSREAKGFFPIADYLDLWSNAERVFGDDIDRVLTFHCHPDQGETIGWTPEAINRAGLVVSPVEIVPFFGPSPEDKIGVRDRPKAITDVHLVFQRADGLWWSTPIKYWILFRYEVNGLDKCGVLGPLDFEDLKDKRRKKEKQ